ncbi:MAG TPA: NAD(P)/FAD-dependent oxidoreductase [Candidatus Limnocylindrales bacterium]|nr:NAD(P)/FAD-dependent oxidoreductase [Candidatus Limnocylindrales bacterium]
MPRQSYDIITVGGGIAASALAKAMAERGARVLVLERETMFKDRVRGEGLVCWGGGEARELGIHELLKETCGHDVPYVESGMGPRDFTTTTPQRLPLLSFPHPVMQETLLAAAQQAGAEVRRGVSVEQIETGRTPAVITDGQSHERITARLVVAADGRGSVARKWVGFASQEQSNPYFMAGVLLTDVKAPPDTIYFVFNPEPGMCIVLFPLGKCRFRSYFAYPKTVGYRLQGESMLSLFIRESARVFPPLAEYYAAAKCIGPLASFDVSDSWVEHPYRDGVVLVGDAAATTDPTFGQGLSLALRDARTLRDELVKDSDWAAAASRYADQRRVYFRTCHTVEAWLRTLFQDPSPEAAALRAKAMPLIAQDPTRVPDHLNSGLDLPLNEQVRAQMFGEC